MSLMAPVMCPAASRMGATETFTSIIRPSRRARRVGTASKRLPSLIAFQSSSRSSGCPSGRIGSGMPRTSSAFQSNIRSAAVLQLRTMSDVSTVMIASGDADTSARIHASCSLSICSMCLRHRRSRAWMMMRGASWERSSQPLTSTGIHSPSAFSSRTSMYHAGCVPASSSASARRAVS